MAYVKIKNIANKPAFVRAIQRFVSRESELENSLMPLHEALQIVNKREPLFNGLGYAQLLGLIDFVGTSGQLEYKVLEENSWIDLTTESAKKQWEIENPDEVKRMEQDRLRVIEYHKAWEWLEAQPQDVKDKFQLLLSFMIVTPKA